MLLIELIFIFSFVSYLVLLLLCSVNYSNKKQIYKFNSNKTV